MRKTVKRKSLRRKYGGVEITTTTAIADLNETIQKRCPDLFLHLDYKKNLPGKIVSYSGVEKPDIAVLCLYTKKIEPAECFSSVEFKVEETDENILYISSKTKQTEENKKYNTLLRACSIVLANKWKFQKIISNAENPISVWLLTKDYKYETDYDFKSFVRNRKITQELIKEYFSVEPEFTYVDVSLPVKENLEKAYEIIEKTPFICK
jgi:hypothetical protein